MSYNVSSNDTKQSKLIGKVSKLGGSESENPPAEPDPWRDLQGPGGQQHDRQTGHWE